jgi:hypothetical protein
VGKIPVVTSNFFVNTQKYRSNTIRGLSNEFTNSSKIYERKLNFRKLYRYWEFLSGTKFLASNQKHRPIFQIWFFFWTWIFFLYIDILMCIIIFYLGWVKIPMATGITGFQNYHLVISSEICQANLQTRPKFTKEYQFWANYIDTSNFRLVQILSLVTGNTGLRFCFGNASRKIINCILIKFVH